MNLLQRSLLAEIHLSFDQHLQGSLSASRLEKIDRLTLEHTVGQLVQRGIQLLTMWADASYGVKFQGWIGGQQPQRPELRMLLDAVTVATKGQPSPTKMAALREAHARYVAVTSVPPSQSSTSPPPG